VNALFSSELWSTKVAIAQLQVVERSNAAQLASTCNGALPESVDVDGDRQGFWNRN
jgi:hypothetical protein